MVPNITLNNGRQFPIIGLGTWNSPRCQVAQAVKDAIDAGYRHIDGAHFYENEREVGEGVNFKIAEGVVKRKDLFITSKLWNCFHDPKDVRGAIEHSLKQLNLTYIDLYLIHWPIGYQKSIEFHPQNEDGEPLHSNFDLLDTWRAMEKLVDAGLTKSIGLSNFNIKQVDYITNNARIQPVTNQFEVHPYLLNEKLRKHCMKKDIVVTAYSPLGSPGRPWATNDDRLILKEPKLLEIAHKYNKSPGQILISFQIQLGNVVIPKSVRKDRIVSNVDVFNFKLNDDEMNDLKNFRYVERFWSFSQDVNHSDYPFHDE